MPFIPANLKQQQPQQQSGFMPVNIKQNQPVQENQDGFFNSVAKNIARPFAREAVNVASALNEVGNIGRLGYGLVTGKPIEQVQLQPQIKSANLPWLGETKGVGMEGTFGQRVKDALGTGAEIASTVVPVGKAPAIAKATLGGKILQGATTGLKAGTAGGALYGFGSELQNPESTVGSVAGSTVLNAFIGGASGGVLGGLLPVPAATFKGAKKLIKSFAPTETMEGVIGLNKADYQKFNVLTKKRVGQYLNEIGAYGNIDDISTKISQRVTESYNKVDNGLAQIKGTYKPQQASQMLQDLIDRETKLGVEGKDTQLINTLATKFNSGGLEMKEINTLKRIYERNVKFGYNKLNNPDVVERATRIDDSLRKWQFKEAADRGFPDLPELNKETQAGKALLNAIGKKYAGDSNQLIGLGDMVLLSGGDPSAISMFLARKTFLNKRVQSSIAKYLYKGGQKVLPEGKVAPSELPIKLLPEGKGSTKVQMESGAPIMVPPKGSPVGRFETTSRNLTGSTGMILPQQRQTGQLTTAYKPTLPQTKNNASSLSAAQEKTIHAFNNSKNHEFVGKIDGEDVVLGSFGKNAIERKISSGKSDRLTLYSLKNDLSHIKERYRAGNDNLRKDNTVFVSEINGKKHAIITRINQYGENEVINYFNISDPDYASKLRVFGIPERIRTSTHLVRTEQLHPLSYGDKSILPQPKKNTSQSGKIPLGPLTGASVGSTVGFEKDENGNIRYNVKKGLAGAAAGAALGFGGGKVGLSMKDISKTPASIARKMDTHDAKIIQDYLKDPKNPTNALKIDDLKDLMGISKAPVDLARRFLNDVLDEFNGVASRKVLPAKL